MEHIWNALILGAVLIMFLLSIGFFFVGYFYIAEIAMRSSVTQNQFEQCLSDAPDKNVCWNIYDR